MSSLMALAVTTVPDNFLVGSVEKLNEDQKAIHVPNSGFGVSPE